MPSEPDKPRLTVSERLLLLLPLLSLLALLQTLERRRRSSSGLCTSMLPGLLSCSLSLDRRGDIRAVTLTPDWTGIATADLLRCRRDGAGAGDFASAGMCVWVGHVRNIG